MKVVESQNSGMEPVAPPDGLQKIAQDLQAYVNTQGQLALTTPLQVQCVLKGDSLMILGQHSLDDPLEPQQALTTLAEGVRTLAIDLATALLPRTTPLPIKLYLRVIGTQKPYAAHQFTQVLPAVGDRAVPDIGLDLGPEPPPQPPRPANLAIHPSVKTRPTPCAQPAPRPHAIPPLYLWGGMAGAIVCAIVGFGLSRPCVVGHCQPLQQAEQIGQQLAAARTEAEGEALTQRLPALRDQLDDIPPWSGQHPAAQATQAVIDQVLQADNQATQARQTMQNLPQPVANLQTAQAQWQAAIATLQQLPNDSPFAGYGQTRIAEYQTQVGAIAAFVSREQQAQQQLQTAQKTIELATAREGIAETPAQWQIAQVTWQMALSSLQKVPNATTSYGKAQDLRKTYQAKATATRDRALREQTGSQALRQAQQLSQQATQFERQNQWSQAMSHWRQALAAAKQVPTNTSQYDQAQTLIATATSAFQQAEQFLRIRTDLEKVCAGATRICDYTISTQVIRVRLTLVYEKKLMTEALLSRSAGDVDTMYAIRKHIGSLETALQTVCNNAGIGLDVYRADNSALIGSFTPNG